MSVSWGLRKSAEATVEFLPQACRQERNNDAGSKQIEKYSCWGYHRCLFYLFLFIDLNLYLDLYVRSRLSSYASQNDQSSSPQNPAQKPKSQRFRWAALGSPGPHGLKRFALHSYQQPPHGQWSRCWRCPWSGANTMPQGVTCNHGMGKWWNHDENEGKSGHNLHPSHNDGCGAVKVFEQQRLFSLTWTACQREDNILTPKGHCGVEIATATICAIFVHEHLEVTSYDKLIAGFHQRTKFWLHGLQDRLPVSQTLDPLPLFHHLTLSLPSLRIGCCSSGLTYQPG